jgi:hypothetical protein
MNRTGKLQLSIDTLNKWGTREEIDNCNTATTMGPVISGCGTSCPFCSEGCGGQNTAATK